VNYIVMLKRKSKGKVEDKEYPVDAQSVTDAMTIALKNLKAEGFYVWGVRKGEGE